MLNKYVKKLTCKYILPLSISVLVNLATCKEYDNVNDMTDNYEITSKTKKDIENPIFYEKEPLKSEIYVLLQEYIDSNTGKKYSLKQSKFENFGRQEFRFPDTGEEITFKAFVNSHDNNLRGVDLEISTDEENYKIYPMSLAGSHYEKKISFDDGAEIKARARVSYEDNTDVVEDYGDFKVYISEVDGQRALEKSIEDTIKSIHTTTIPSVVDTDYIENIREFKIKFDKILRFRNPKPVLGEFYRKQDCFNGILSILEYVSRNNDLTIDDKVVDPYEIIEPHKLSVRDLLMDSYQCPGNNNYKDGNLKGIGFSFIYYHNHYNPSTPTTKSDIADIVKFVLKRYSREIHYKTLDDYLKYPKKYLIFF